MISIDNTESAKIKIQSFFIVISNSVHVHSEMKQHFSMDHSATYKINTINNNNSNTVPCA